LPHLIAHILICLQAAIGKVREIGVVLGAGRLLQAACCLCGLDILVGTGDQISIAVLILLIQIDVADLHVRA